MNDDQSTGEPANHYPRMLCSHIRNAWEEAVLALNTAQNSGLPDSATKLCQIVAALSQELQFAEFATDPKNAQFQ